MHELRDDRGQHQKLQDLPEELISAIFEFLPRSDLYSSSLVSKWFYNCAARLIWKSVELVDCRKDYGNNGKEPSGFDEHDDTPILRKLLLFARNPHIARYVTTLTHRCHLPPPDSFLELPRMPFKSPSISHHPYVQRIMELAVRNLANVQTLRIIYGHWLVTIGLLQQFFHYRRQRNTPVRRLWLENCCIDGVFDSEGINYDFTGLEAVRFRRMRLAPQPLGTYNSIALSRGEGPLIMQDGKGSTYLTTCNLFSDLDWKETDMEKFVPGPAVKAIEFDRQIYSHLPEVFELLGVSNHEECNWKDVYSQLYDRVLEDDPNILARRMIESTASSLTSLNLDWVFLSCPLHKGETRKDLHNQDGLSDGDEKRVYMPFLASLAKLNFPNLKAFQLRNAVTSGTSFTELVPLFGRSHVSFLDFMERHSNLKCLGWPMSQFFTGDVLSREDSQRVDSIIENLSQSLTDLRVDADYNGQGEPQTQILEFIGLSVHSLHSERNRRRLFISDFASRMRNVEHIKIEGCIPRDERRETFRALRKCKLQRIISIGVSSSLGNTWGPRGIDLLAVEEGSVGNGNSLQPEHTAAISSLTTSPLSPTREPFQPTYGWPPSPPMLHTIASDHASSITELKFCGYRGSPILTHPTPITAAFLYPLRHFHNLRQLVLSMWLITFFEDNWQDREIIEYWLDQREPSSTALAMIPRNDGEGDEGSETNAWAQMLQQRYDPPQLARQVRDIVAPHLSPTAKARKDGVNVRASFSLGVETSNMFDIDVRIGAGDEILGFKGPREELEKERRKEKLESRRWF